MSQGTHRGKTIHLAADHAGLILKNAIKAWLLEQQYQVVDHGAHQFDAEDDFPDFIGEAAAAVSKHPEHAIAIIFGGSGQGEAMAANRFPNVRASVYYRPDMEIIGLSRSHNDANVLSIGARFLDEAAATDAIAEWLSIPFAGDEKRVRRNKKLELLTKSNV